jgi:excinuclease ABC subunit C
VVTLLPDLAQIPDAPGVYLMIGSDREILYIGKAISLRNRVRSYFQEAAVLHPRTIAMVAKVADVRTIVVTNEVEALILEANLIKRHQPPFNVRLRDDKRYPYLKVTNEAFPRIVFTRMVRNDGARYFGPYTNAHGLRELIDLVRLVFPLRTCPEPIDGRRKRPCLQYHIKRCLAPCVGYQTEEDYDRTIDEVVLFLEGKQESLLARLQHEMSESAEHLNFEAAARLRDRIVQVRRVTEGQKVVWRSRLDMDLVAIARSQGQACMQVFLVRGGKLIGQEHFILEGVYEQSDELLTGEFLKQFYTARTAGAPEDKTLSLARIARDNQAPVPEKRRPSKTQAAAVPKELLVSSLPEERATIETWLSTIKGQRVRILKPQRGVRAEYLRLVQKNAEQNLKAFLAHQEVQETAQARALTGCVHGRLRRRAREEERIPKVQDSVRSGPERLCDDAGDAAAAPALSAPRDGPYGHADRARASEEREVQSEAGSAADRWREGAAQRGSRGTGGARHDRSRGRGAGEGARVALPSESVRADRFAAQLTGASPRRAHSRRGAPFCGHLPSPAAGKIHDALGAGRARRRGAGSA